MIARPDPRHRRQAEAQAGATLDAVGGFTRATTGGRIFWGRTPGNAYRRAARHLLARSQAARRLVDQADPITVLGALAEVEP